MELAGAPARVVDSHVHFWDVDALRYPWLDDEPELRRTFQPGDLAAAQAEAGVTVGGAVFVQADCVWGDAAQEVTWVEHLAAAGAPVLGIVAAVPLERGAACRRDISELSDRPLVVGVRRLLQDEPNGFALSDDFVEAVNLLGSAGLVFDACVRHHQLRDIVELAGRCPDVTLVLDHLGKPDVSAGAWHPWADDLAALAAQPNVVCKVSGLGPEASPERRTVDALRPYVSHAMEVFGADRCMFGSDWPVSTTAMTYASWIETVNAALSGASDTERAAVWGATASRVYGLTVGAPC